MFPRHVRVPVLVFGRVDPFYYFQPKFRSKQFHGCTLSGTCRCASAVYGGLQRHVVCAEVQHGGWHGAVWCGIWGKSVSDTAGAHQRVAPHRLQQWTDCPQSKRRTWRPCHQTDTRLRHQRRGRCLNVCDVIKGREDRRKIRPLMGCTSLANISQHLGTLCVLVDPCASGRTCASRSNCTEQPISHFFDFLFVHCKLILCADGTGKKRGVHIRIQYVGGWGCGRVDACVRVRVCEAA